MHTLIPKTKILGALAALALVHSHAQTNFTETFESGNLNLWTIYGTQLSLDIATPTNRVPTGGSNAARMTNSMCRMYATSLPGTIGYGITAESFKFGYYYYDNSGTATRAFCEVRNYPGGTFGTTGFGQILAIGKYNSVTMAGETYKGTKYQARIVNGLPNGWFNLDAPGSPNRSTGWHRFDIERGKNVLGEVVLSFYVDNVLSRVFTNSNANAAWDSVILGSGIGNAPGTTGDAWFDGFEIIQGQTFISGQPQGTTNSVGQDATLTVSAIGDADPLSYQWWKNGNAIAGATDSSYTIVNCQLTNSGNYSVVVSNLLAVKTSDAAYLQVNPLNLITVAPTNQFVNIGSNATLYAEATGGGTIYYQWKLHGTNLPGATGTGAFSTYEILGATPDQAGPYTVTVTNDLNDPPTTSPAALLQVNNFPVLTAANHSSAVGLAVDLVVAATDDYSPQSAAFQGFETNALGRHTMFAYPAGSGTTDGYVDNPGISAVANTSPAPHGGGANVLQVAWNWTNAAAPAGWLRLTTAASAGAQDMPNPIIYVTGPLRFDMWCSKDLLVGAGLREANPTGAIGTDAGASSSGIEFVGVLTAGSVPAPSLTNTVVASNWTTVEISLPDVGVGNFSSANSILDFTTGKQTLEHLTLAPADTNPGEYLMYLDNFVSVPTNAMTFELISGPAGATVDKYTGRVQWTPTALGASLFTVKVTDAWGLPDEKSFTINVVNLTTPVSISGISGQTLNYTGGAGTQFVLLSSTDVSAPRSAWTRVATNTVTPGSFNLTPAPGGRAFYSVQSE